MKLTFDKKIDDSTTETRIGRGRFSVPTGKVKYTRPAEAKSHVLKKAMKKEPITYKPKTAFQYGDKGYKPSNGIGVGH